MKHGLFLVLFCWINWLGPSWSSFSAMDGFDEASNFESLLFDQRDEPSNESLNTILQELMGESHESRAVNAPTIITIEDSEEAKAITPDPVAVQVPSTKEKSETKKNVKAKEPVSRPSSKVVKRYSSVWFPQSKRNQVQGSFSWGNIVYGAPRQPGALFFEQVHYIPSWSNRRPDGVHIREDLFGVVIWANYLVILPGLGSRCPMSRALKTAVGDSNSSVNPFHIPTNIDSLFRVPKECICDHPRQGYFAAIHGEHLLFNVNDVGGNFLFFICRKAMPEPILIHSPSMALKAGDLLVITPNYIGHLISSLRSENDWSLKKIKKHITSTSGNLYISEVFIISIGRSE